jgi:hypothetical protein
LSLNNKKFTIVCDKFEIETPTPNERYDMSGLQWRVIGKFHVYLQLNFIYEKVNIFRLFHR